VQPAEETQRHVPHPVVDELAYALVVGEPSAEVGVEWRAGLAVAALLEEDLRLAQAA
jgi:hypothetical protein